MYRIKSILCRKNHCEVKYVGISRNNVVFVRTASATKLSCITGIRWVNPIQSQYAHLGCEFYARTTFFETKLGQRKRNKLTWFLSKSNVWFTNTMTSKLVHNYCHMSWHCIDCRNSIHKCQKNWPRTQKTWQIQFSPFFNQIAKYSAIFTSSLLHKGKQSISNRKIRNLWLERSEIKEKQKLKFVDHMNVQFPTIRKTKRGNSQKRLLICLCGHVCVCILVWMCLMSSFVIVLLFSRQVLR